MLTDDLPWPELGNVSRGATRGNQGQKGVLGPPDNEGRCLLQLRVQPGVLAVRLNRQASDWYRTLDTEVNRALKLTKTYWRKARRRQDYDARADQDHIWRGSTEQRALYLVAELKASGTPFQEIRLQVADMLLDWQENGLVARINDQGGLGNKQVR